MNLIDLLRMSFNNLTRRKLRTFLTVLGVIIGTTSIVVMISLGLGMQQSLYQEVEQSGGLTTITVTGTQAGSSYTYISDSSTDSSSTKYIDDSLVKELSAMDHVKIAYPVYSMDAILLKGKYACYVSIEAMPHTALETQKFNLKAGGTIPEQNGELEFIYGNMLITSFYEKATNIYPYYDNGELPDIDLEHDSMFLVLDIDSYYQSQSTSSYSTDSSDAASTTNATAKKHVVKASGVVSGSPEEYNSFSYGAYCDLDILKQLLKKEFSGRVIPGQPSTKTGKAYKEFYYSAAKVEADDVNEVDTLATAIRELGYNVETNVEYVNSMKKQFAMIQAALGGIGAISLLVAAIGIANTMMMSIYERTKEIGVIKVLGCSLRNIKQMFLMEAACIGLIGGIIGNILSFILSALINYLTGHGSSLGFSGDISYIPIWLSLLSIVFAVLVGVLAGYFPAKRAMNLSPLEAIRNS